MEERQIIIYAPEGGNIKIEVPIDGQTVWLSQKQMADLFDYSIDNIGLHLKNIYSEGELSEQATTEESSVVQAIITLSEQMVKRKKELSRNT